MQVMSPMKKLVGPPWLIPLLKASYFIPCKTHLNSSNFYCLDCISDDALCSYCLVDHKEHDIVQLNGMKHDTNLTFFLGKKSICDYSNWSNSDSDDSPMQKKLRKLDIPKPNYPNEDFTKNTTTSTSTSNIISPGTPPIMSYRTNRRKGIPHRAPL